MNRSKKIVRFILSFSILFLIFSSNFAQTEKLEEILDQIDDIEYTKTDPSPGFEAKYKIMVNQPVDHFDKESANFQQLVYLAHKSFEAPMVMSTEGYLIFRTVTSEPAALLEANQLTVEHRYFGRSQPGDRDFKFLNIKQAAYDHHRIVEIFSKIYKGKWINTGGSKSGQCALFHKRFFPEDVQATIAYVAPINLAREDPRIMSYLKSLGTDECWDKIKAFQHAVLADWETGYESFSRLASATGASFSKLGPENVFEYMVLEYPFSHFQFGEDVCDAIPASESPVDSLIAHLFQKTLPFFYSDKAYEMIIRPFTQQAYTELGYYAYDISELKEYLRYADGSNDFYIPDSIDLKFNCRAMNDIKEWLDDYGNNIIYIYGKDDPWTASAVELTGKTNALKYISDGGNHTAKISSFPPEMKKEVIDSLRAWLNMEITVPED